MTRQLYTFSISLVKLEQWLKYLIQKKKKSKNINIWTSEEI